MNPKHRHYKKEKIENLRNYEANSRTHSKEQIEKLVKSINEFGFTNPLLIDEKNVLIAGHARLEAATKCGMTELPCIVIDDLTPEQKAALVIADNRLALDAGWDNDILRSQFEFLKESDYDLLHTGFDVQEIADIFPADDPEVFCGDDECPKPPEEPVTKVGDVWLLGEHRLMCGDSTDINAIECLTGGKRADLVYCDPPYGMSLDTDYSSMKSDFKGGQKGKKYNKVKGDNKDFAPELISTVLNNFSYCKEIFLWGADYYAELLPEKNKGSWIVWDKRLEDSSDKMYGSCFELCWSKGRHKRDIARIKWAGLFGTEQEFDRKRFHPTQKPILLSEWFIEKYSDKKNIVVDLYGGSGSTLIACEKLGRKCYMMELSEQYCDVIIKRYENYSGKKAILENKDA